jgi:hypothetical protein
MLNKFSAAASDQGCNGGLMDNAYQVWSYASISSLEWSIEAIFVQWIIENGGLAGEDAYPYVSGNGTTGVCKKPKLKVKAVILRICTDQLHSWLMFFVCRLISVITVIW